MMCDMYKRRYQTTLAAAWLEKWCAKHIGTFTWIKNAARGTAVVSVQEDVYDDACKDEGDMHCRLVYF